MKLISASIIRNVENFIVPMIESIQWVDHIVIVDDHSDDQTTKRLSGLRSKYNTPITVVEPWFTGTMFSVDDTKRNVSREMEIRNHFIDFLFNDFKPDALILIDGDELMSENLKEHIIQARKEDYDSTAFTCNHLFSRDTYLHVYEQRWNGVTMVDPHVRVLFKKKYYQHGEWVDVPDCFLKHTGNTKCLDGPFHYHLKYVNGLSKVNHSFKFMSSVIDSSKDREYIKPLRHGLPEDINRILNNYFSYALL